MYNTGIFPNSASGNGIWALGSEISKKNGLGNGTGTSPFRTLLRSCLKPPAGFAEREKKLY